MLRYFRFSSYHEVQANVTSSSGIVVLDLSKNQTFLLTTSELSLDLTSKVLPQIQLQHSQSRSYKGLDLSGWE